MAHKPDGPRARWRTDILRPQAMRQANVQTGLVHFQERRQLSRAELARLTGLNKATASEIVDDLLTYGFLAPVGLARRPAAGRPAELFAFNPTARLVLGLELSDVQSVAVVADLDGRALHVTSAPSSPDGATALALGQDMLDQVLDDVAAETVVGIGVGVPGVVAADAGAIEFAPDLGWRDLPVRATLEAHFGLPVVVANRAKAAALAECWTGAARGSDRMLYVSVGSGISAGIVLDGRLYRGASAREGELGHVTVLPEGPLCACGNRGCLQVLAAAPALLADLRERVRLSDAPQLADSLFHASDVEALAACGQAVRDGDAAANAALDRAAMYIGIATANAVNLLNPRMVVFGGAVVRAIPQLVERVADQVGRRAIGPQLGGLAIVPAALGEEAVALGGATLLLTDRATLVQFARERADGGKRELARARAG